MKKTLPSIINTSNMSNNAITQKGLFNNLILPSQDKNNKNIQKNGKKESNLEKIIVGTITAVIATVIYFGPSPWMTKIAESTRRQVEGVNDAIKIIPTPTPVDTCNSPDLIESALDFSHYHKDSEDYYLPNETSNKKFWYPPIAYKNKISGVFQKINIEYEASYQNENSTSSATLFIAIYDGDNDEILEIDAPEPNRQIIGFKKMGKFSDKGDPIMPVPLSPVILTRQVAYGRTHTISITANRYNLYDSIVTYTISGLFIDSQGNSQTLYKDIPVEIPSSDPNLKEFRLIIGIGIEGKLKIKKINVCDR